MTTIALPSTLRFGVRRLLGLLAAAFVVASSTGCEQSMITRSNDAAGVLRDFQLSDQKIPESELKSAQAIAVLRETEAGVVVNAGGGKGVMVQRTKDGWSAPIALDSTTGSFGAQIGGKSRDIVMIFRSQAEVDKVVSSGGYSLADASAAAGPMADAARQDDNPVVTYARVAGIFAGARIGGVKFDVNEQVNRETYGMNFTTEEILEGKAPRPLGTSEFYKLLPPPPR
jgi:lipid-binding SYLF domain-containing protein